MDSLINQPGRDDKSLAALLKEAGLEEGKRTGIAGWKMFTSPIEKNEKMYEVPSFITDAIRDIAGDGNMTNETGLFIGKGGVRTTNNANEIAHYEFGAALASDCMLDAMDLIDEGVTEMELGDRLVRYGQHTSVVTIAASGPRFVRGNMYPTENRIKVGDAGWHGGLSYAGGNALLSLLCQLARWIKNRNERRRFVHVGGAGSAENRVSLESLPGASDRGRGMDVIPGL